MSETQCSLAFEEWWNPREESPSLKPIAWACWKAAWQSRALDAEAVIREIRELSCHTHWGKYAKRGFENAKFHVLKIIRKHMGEGK